MTASAAQANLNKRLASVQLAYRDLSLKSRREVLILKRLISRLSVACRGQNQVLDRKLMELKSDLEHGKDVSTLVPRLAVVERMISKQSAENSQEHDKMEVALHRSGEVLKRMQGLPAQLKRDLRNLLQSPAQTRNEANSRVIELLKLYERALKSLTVSPSHSNSIDSIDPDLLNKLADELQHLITELDFDGEAGATLLDIRNRLLLVSDSRTLIELSLESIKLVLQGTHAERKASQKFLGQVNDDLAGLQKSNAQTSDSAASIIEQRETMLVSMEEIASELENTVGRLPPENENTAVVANIASEMHTIVEQNLSLSKREQDLMEKLKATESKISQLFEQTLDYRRRLGDQERRMFLDHLTKAYNRAALNDRLEHEYRCWLRYQRPLCLAIIDIDHFKEINDRFGHLAGDKALKVIAKTIQQSVRDTDFVARFGGEEFVVLMADANEETQHNILATISESISKLPFKFKNERVSITISIGATVFRDNDSPTEVIERADIGLYDAKNRGRNRTHWV
ncbi:diguanylate cyclase [Parasalinivibrio latis]|uniref:GGDEF domain-containing protein n=1 Tax=Parasalinivibrio latis TaxID=2952610 RepID=UPI0030E5BFFD